ncbi:MAG: hypothetical protein ONB05_07770 [candidate division KSB1 bacterium]|nr:hypothetical protein [candidate division KSB1 bacterium]
MHKRRQGRRWLILFGGYLAGLIPFANSLAQNNSGIVYDKRVLYKVSFSDSALIEIFQNEFTIPETLVTRMEVFDIDENGFGQRDIVRTWPSGRIYFMAQVSDSVKKIMGQWSPPNFFIAVGKSTKIDTSGLEENERPELRILRTLLSAVQKYYSGNPLKIWFEQNASGFCFELWEGESNSLKSQND